MPRKVNHSKNISPRDVSGRKYIPGDIVEFTYKGSSDKKPLVLVLQKDTKIIRGVNINYLTKYEVGRLLEETNYKKMRYYNLYEDAYRTYSLDKISMTKIMEYIIDE
mgnify:FL=1|tara:strand:- start:59 stop:379 length:321 start_codon:yes stop_codon:yes gene_type:complete